MATFDWGKGLVKGFFWGALIGVVVGILITTKRDKGTWEDIGKSADALVDKTKEQIGQAQRKMAGTGEPREGFMTRGTGKSEETGAFQV